MQAATLLKIRRHLSVAHHIPGRLRLKIKPGLLGDPTVLSLVTTPNFKAWAKGKDSPAIKNTRLNPGAGSLVLEYDPGQLSPDLVSELLHSPDAGRVTELMEKLADILGLDVSSH